MKRSLTLVELCAVASLGCVIQLEAGSAKRADTGGSVPAAGSGAVSDAAPEAEPTGHWVNATGNLAGLKSECGDLSGLSAKPDEDVLIVGVAARGLFASADGGESWKALGQSPDSQTISNRAMAFVYDPADSHVWWEAGIYGLGVFQTKDNGGSFKAAGMINHVDTLAIDFSDPRRGLLLAAGHETPRAVYRSDDGGDTWRSIGGSLPEAIGCQNIVLLDSNTYVIGCDYNGEAIYRTTDAGESWQMVSAEGGARSPLHASDGSYYWARPGGGMVRSVDQGVTWTVVTANRRLRPLAPVELPDGRVAAVGITGIAVSDDKGASWKRVTSALPFEDASGFVYSTHRHAFYIKHFQCLNENDTVLPDAIMRFDFEL